MRRRRHITLALAGRRRGVGPGRRGAPLLGAAVVGGVAYHAGSSAAKNQARETQQTQQISDLQAQQDAMMAQQAAPAGYAPPPPGYGAQPQYAPPPPQYAPPPPAYAPAPPQYAPAPPQYAPEPPQYAAPPPAPMPPAGPPPGAMTDEKIAQLQKLGELRQAGVLTDEEFNREKANVLAM